MRFGTSIKLLPGSRGSNQPVGRQACSGASATFLMVASSLMAPFALSLQRACRRPAGPVERASARELPINSATDPLCSALDSPFEVGSGFPEAQASRRSELHQHVATRHRVSGTCMDANGHANDARAEAAQSRKDSAFDARIEVRCDLDVVTVNHELHCRSPFNPAEVPLGSPRHGAVPGRLTGGARRGPRHRCVSCATLLQRLLLAVRVRVPAQLSPAFRLTRHRAVQALRST